MDKTTTRRRLLLGCLLAAALAFAMLPLAAFAADPPDEIEVYVLRDDGEEFGPYTIKAEDDWYLEITDLPKYDADENPYVYTVVESPIAGYDTTVITQVDTSLDDYYYMVLNKTQPPKEAKKTPSTFDMGSLGLLLLAGSSVTGTWMLVRRYRKQS